MGRCKFWKNCEYFDEDSYTCNETSGMYYDDGDGFSRPSGCFRNKEEELERIKL